MGKRSRQDPRLRRLSGLSQAVTKKEKGFWVGFKGAKTLLYILARPRVGRKFGLGNALARKAKFKRF